jgi:outer membrane protein, multidrug efflux system
VKSYPMVLALLVTLTPATAWSQSGDSSVVVVTLQEARRRAMSVDPDAVESRTRVHTAEWEKRSAFARLVTPTLTGGLSYIRFSDPFFNFGTGNISPNATSATLEASYSILGSGRWGALRSSRASVESAEAGETAERFRTALAADEAYYAVLAERELGTVAADRLKRAQESFGIARVRVSAGEAIASDSLQLLLEVNRARLDMLSRDSAIVASRWRLGSQVGVSGPVDAAPIDSAMPLPLPMTQDEAAREMLMRGPDVEAARANERRAGAVLGAERERYFPSISLGATTGAYDANFFPSALKRTQYALTVSVPFWDGGARELSVARLAADRDVARARRQERERSAGELVAQAYHGYTTSRARIELTTVGVAVATENFRVQNARYREGATTILDLLEAQVALSEAQASLVQARFTTRLSLARIEALLGRRVFETPNQQD